MIIALLVPPRDELEEQVRAALLERQVPELIHDEPFRLRIEREPLRELPFGLCLRERVQQRGRAREEHGIPSTAARPRPIAR
jgi:hypothetical protein